MNIKRIFVDANVIIDTFDKSRKESISSEKAIRHLLLKKVDLYTSCDLITTVYYVLRKKHGKEALKDIEDALNVYILIPFSNHEVKQALELIETDPKFKDLEDTLQYVLAKKEKCDLILTNDKEFYSPDIKIYTPTDFIKN
ncbi:hypothetical protein SAMN06265182_0856 [Persephonella hydrogeniphila]|uniref:PIN domain-containing protein n=1 Tax=Persephonella hydrogeniphila TaxID=198703 RepID=A0A285NBT3_9AQUI|nr:PIN domain-containing protein [Persephonella hydrogeniphila]SNZ06954.1 hypothetical protein SAMN06265182_0856 [Persephonella hydrogeniphila]